MTTRLIQRIAVHFVLLSGALAATAAAQTVTERSSLEAFKIESNLRAGVAKFDVTPPVDTKVAGHVRQTHGARDPIRAAVLLLDDGRTKAAIVTFDFLCAWDELVQEVRDAVSRVTNTPRENILVATSHNHSGPEWSPGSPYCRQMIDKVGAAAADAMRGMRPVSLGYGEGMIHFNINRRQVINGRAVVRLNPDGPCDRRVKVLRVDDGKSLAPMAVVMHAVCHPCVFTWGDKASLPIRTAFQK
jgi:neutral ceramidase